ncbi:MAG: hypothetical protein JSV12_01925 [Candidatus Bathyarchaeota archaeon]|nr:MAG: hypothetical protein JSV12_01925 [Candidatus Bathyarchaeota archaeon]
MDKNQVIRNEDVSRVLIGVPEGHKHLRIYLELKNTCTLIFQEATVAKILRAYTTIKTHPNVQARELKMKTITAEQPKKDYATHQLLETPKKDEEIEKEISEFLRKAEAYRNRDRSPSSHVTSL